MTNRNIFTRKLLYGFFMVILMSAGKTDVYALHGQYGAHDPSGIVRCGDRYWIYTTGRGPYSMYSTDLVNWSTGQTPLTPGTFPSWVTSYVPDFGGTFWAPDCMYMNGQYYLYYSCSSWGSTVSCIGLLSSKSLNPDSPDYAWKDEGMVIYSTASSNYNCIDPAVRRDKEGKIWLTYGSHWDGIRMVELDSVSGKVTGSTTFSVAGKGDYKTEASYMISHGDYYYLFYNRVRAAPTTSRWAGHPHPRVRSWIKTEPIATREAARPSPVPRGVSSVQAASGSTLRITRSS
jgi:arabinan endo-1,5-alpha-L-arabinosidase